MDEFVTATKGSLVKAAARMETTLTLEKYTRDQESSMRMTRSRVQTSEATGGVVQTTLYRLGIFALEIYCWNSVLFNEVW